MTFHSVSEIIKHYFTGFCNINYNESPGATDAFQLYGDMVDMEGIDAEVTHASLS